MTTTSKWILGIIVLALIVWVGMSMNTKAIPPIEGSVKIGVSSALSGVAAYYGEENKKGVDLAQAQISGKYPEIDFVVLHEDNAFTPKGGIDNYHKLRDIDGVDAVITHTSPVAMAIHPLAQQDGVLQMAVSSSASGYSSPNDLSFRTTAGTDIETEVMVHFIKEQGFEKIGIVYMNNEIGVSLQESLRKQLEAGVVVLSEGFALETTDFRTLIVKLKQQDVDAVYVAGTTAHLASILRQSSENDFQTQFMGFRTFEDPSLIENVGVLSEGVVYTYAFDGLRDDAEVLRFVDAYKAAYGVSPNGLAAEGYEGYRLVAESFAACGKDYECIGTYLRGLKKYPSVFGPLSFDENGDVAYEFFIKTIRDGEFVKY